MLDRPPAIQTPTNVWRFMDYIMHFFFRLHPSGVQEKYQPNIHTLSRSLLVYTYIRGMGLLRVARTTASVDNVELRWPAV